MRAKPISRSRSGLHARRGNQFDEGAGVLGSRRLGSGVFGSRRVGLGTRVGLDGCRRGVR